MESGLTNPPALIGTGAAKGVTSTLAKNLGCDSLYLALCQKQNCYRIRLTPKSETYAIRSRTCRFIGILGEDLESCHEVQALIQIHDIRTGALDSAGGLLLG